jgi:hypothetical protein
MEDLFEMITRKDTGRRGFRRRPDNLKEGALREALGGPASQREFLDLDHAIAARSTRQSETEALEFEPGSLEIVEEEELERED